MAESPPLRVTGNAAPGNGGTSCCAICISDYKRHSVVVTLACGHRFHASCLVANAVHGTSDRACPLCRASIDYADDDRLMRAMLCLRRVGRRRYRQGDCSCSCRIQCTGRAIDAAICAAEYGLCLVITLSLVYAFAALAQLVVKDDGSGGRVLPGVSKAALIVGCILLCACGCCCGTLCGSSTPTRR